MLAQKNIHTFHNSQRFEGKKVQTVSGVTCWQKAVADVYKRQQYYVLNNYIMKYPIGIQTFSQIRENRSRCV